MKKECSKRERGPRFCLDFWARFGDHSALYHISIVIIPTLMLKSTSPQQKTQETSIPPSTSPQNQAIQHQKTQEIYNKLQTPPPPSPSQQKEGISMATKLHESYRKTQELQELYKVHQKKSTPPTQIHKVIEEQIPPSTIQEKAEELYKTLQTPPPQENSKMIDHSSERIDRIPRKPFNKELYKTFQTAHQQEHQTPNVEQIKKFHQEAHELYKNLQNRATKLQIQDNKMPLYPPHSQSIQQKTQEIYNNLQTPPPQMKKPNFPRKMTAPPQDKKMAHPLVHNSHQLIQQTTQEIYNKLQTPPPQMDHQNHRKRPTPPPQVIYQNLQKKSTPPLPPQENRIPYPPHTQSIHQKTQEIYNNLQTPPPQMNHHNPRKRPPSPPQIIHQNINKQKTASPHSENRIPYPPPTITQSINQKTEEIYKNLQSPPVRENKIHQHSHAQSYYHKTQNLVQNVIEKKMENEEMNEQKANIPNIKQSGKTSMKSK